MSLFCPFLVVVMQASRWKSSDQSRIGGSAIKSARHLRNHPQQNTAVANNSNDNGECRRGNIFQFLLSLVDGLFRICSSGEFSAVVHIYHLHSEVVNTGICNFLFLLFGEGTNGQVSLWWFGEVFVKTCFYEGQGFSWWW